ncbi:hypothetical protein Syun_026665 [Stephania yunnanensis]|uniref:RING-type E3 ubiquitin transferase n=1 Tax=Stephania yunnanensis TaxID=152371 RepID=A0AAP0EWP3_9MAGN
MGSHENVLKERLEDLQKQVGRKNSFEEAVNALKTLLIENYSSASPSLKKLMYSAVRRVSTILQTRYTAPGFWFAGKGLFLEAQRLFTEPSERDNLKVCISKASEHLHEVENQPEQPSRTEDSRYLFEGHMTVDPEPPRPAWLNIYLMGELMTRMGNTFEDIDHVIEASLQFPRSVVIFLGYPSTSHHIVVIVQEIGAGPQRPPPASKAVVQKLPVVTVTKEVLERLGTETQCAVCQENLSINDSMQELPCQHLFHPPCLKPWLDEHNSCPICRHELPTDDHAYESKKERDREAEEERKGAENALPGGEYMYV